MPLPSNKSKSTIMSRYISVHLHLHNKLIDLPKKLNEDHNNDDDKAGIEPTESIFLTLQENVYIEELAELITVSIDSMNSLSVKPDKCAILQESLNQLQQIREKDGRALVGNISASDSSGCSTMTVNLL